MFNSIKKLLYEGTPLLSQSRGYANMVAATRIKDPQKMQKKDLKEMETDPVTNLKIMRDFDASGSDHRFLIDFESKDSRGYYYVYGMFTTSSYPWLNKKPELVENFTLLGGKKNQYFHRYSQPNIIHQSDVRIDYLSTLTLHEKEGYDRFTKKIKNEIENKT